MDAIKFTLEIDLGNEAMLTPSDVAGAVSTVAKALNARDFHVGHTSSLMDSNGNRVGSWRLHPEGCSDCLEG